MAEQKIVKSWGIGCARQTILAIVVFLVLLVGFIGLVVVSITLPVSDHRQVFLWAAGFILLVLLSVTLIVFWMNRQVRKRATQIEAAFTPLGIFGKGYLWNGRQFHGIYRGRQVDTYFSRGPTLDIYLASPLSTRLGIGLRGRTYRTAPGLLSETEPNTEDPQLAKFSIYALDPAWGRELVNHPQAKAILLHLLSCETSLEFRNLTVQPEALHLQINRVDMDVISSENMRSIFDELIDLSAIAESLPAPQITAHASAMERRARMNRSGFTLPMAAITCGMVSFLAVIFVVALLMVIQLSGGRF